LRRKAKERYFIPGYFTATVIKRVNAGGNVL